MLIQLENIGKFFPEKDLFLGVNLQVNEGDRIGLVGPNGAGKTQLLGILTGDVSPEEGKVNSRSRLRIGKLDQEVTFPPGASVLEAALEAFGHIREMEAELVRLEEAISHAPRAEAESLMRRYSEVKDHFEREDGYAYRQRAGAVLHGLGFSREDFSLDCGVLSGGQLNRLGLARLLLGRPDLLLLDEPTNHLDLEAVRWLEEFLQTWESAFVVVSHDRYFLDRTVNQVWEISGRRVNSWPGNYSRFQRDRARRLEQQRKEWEGQQTFITKTEEFIRRNMAGQKTKQAQSRQKMLDKLDVVDRPTQDIRQLRLDLSDAPRSSETVLVLESLSVGYGTPLLRLPFEMTITRGERIGILGENGTGKTTLFRTLLGQLPPVSGRFAWGRNVSVGYFDQKMDTLTGSPLQEIRLMAPLAPEVELRTFLARFGFVEDDVFKPLEALSGGERNRLMLARLMYGRHNVLVLDEPTNHLDIDAREELEEALETFPGTLLVISHDRYFLERMTNLIFHADGGDVTWFRGGYREWEAARNRKEAEAGKPSAAATPASEREKPAGLSKNERFRLEKQLVELEAEVATVEARLAEVEGVLQCPSPSVGAGELTSLADEYQGLTARLAGLMETWEDLAARLA